MRSVCCYLENRNKTATTGFKSCYLHKLKRWTSTLFYQKWNSSGKLIQIPFLHVLFCNLQSSIVVQKQSRESQCSTWWHVPRSASFDSLHPSCWSTCCKLAIATVPSLHKCSNPNRKWLFTSVSFSRPHFRFPAANEKCWTLSWSQFDDRIDWFRPLVLLNSATVHDTSPSEPNLKAWLTLWAASCSHSSGVHRVSKVCRKLSENTQEIITNVSKTGAGSKRSDWQEPFSSSSSGDKRENSNVMQCAGCHIKARKLLRSSRRNAAIRLVSTSATLKSY